MSALTIAQVGVSGFGRIHLQRIDRLASLGRVRLVAVADPAGPADRTEPWFPTLTDLLAGVDAVPDIVSIATPIGLHLDLAREAMSAGADVFLEKPPVASWDEFTTLLAHAERTGRVVQIGFQSLGSAGVARMRSLVADDELGEGATVGARGVWIRDRAYYARAPWAGRRVINGRRIADGVVTNPLAHSVATALAIAQVGQADVEAVETELYRAHDIEADDTSFVRILTRNGRVVSVGLTLCGPDQSEPEVVVEGPRGIARYQYTADVLDLVRDGVRTQETFVRTCLLENLVDHLELGADLLVPLASTAAFMCVLEATQDRTLPVEIPAGAITWVGEGPQGHPVVDDVAGLIDRGLHDQRGFAASGAPWADAEAALRTWRPPVAPQG